MRFAIAGGVVALFYLVVTTTLAVGLGVPFLWALPIGFGAGMAAHFTLQRVFVWAQQTEFALRTHQQAGRYLVVAGLQYATTAATTRFLPRALGLSVTVVYVVTALLITAVNFVVFRTRVFHPKGELPVPHVAPACPEGTHEPESAA
jgi:putative flippase GtrA